MQAGKEEFKHGEGGFEAYDETKEKLYQDEI